jgi:heme exporter protein C
MLKLAFLHPYASLMHFYRLSRRLTPWLAAVAVCLFVLGLGGGLVYAPSDYQQGDAFRIIYVHVPSAWMSLFVYVVMAAAGACALVWKLKLAEILCRGCAPLGASFTFLALVTGAIWGKPMWGAWWVWDARLTSELILLFLYLGVMALQSAFEDRRVAARAGAVLSLIGVVNIPIIHYSVEWWSTLHQGPTVSKLDAPSIHVDMLIPLLIMCAAFMAYFAGALLVRMRCEILRYDRHSQWIEELLAGGTARTRLA